MIIILSLITLMILISVFYFMAGAWKIIVEKDKSFIHFNSILLAIITVLIMWFFLVLRLAGNGN